MFLFLFETVIICIVLSFSSSKSKVISPKKKSKKVIYKLSVGRSVKNFDFANVKTGQLLNEHQKPLKDAIGSEISRCLFQLFTVNTECLLYYKRNN